MTFFAIFARWLFTLNIVAIYKPLTPAGPLCSKVLGKNYFIENELSNMIEKSNLRPKFPNLSFCAQHKPSSQLHPYYSFRACWRMLYESLEAGGKPSTRFPPERLVEHIITWAARTKTPEQGQALKPDPDPDPDPQARERAPASGSRSGLRPRQRPQRTWF